MELTTKKVEIRKLVPSEGMWLTRDDVKDATERPFSKEVYLAASDSPDNWRECSEEEKEAYETEAKELMEQEQPINE